MVCYEVWVNGEKVCTAGVGEYGLLSTILSWVGPRPSEPTLSMGGLANDEHFEWLRQSLQIGDEVKIRLIEAETADPPTSRYRLDPAAEKDSQRLFYEACKREFDGEAEKP